MSDPYEETLQGELCLRLPPGARHEEICQRLHARVAESLSQVTSTRLLPLRSVVKLTRETEVRPDLALVTTAMHQQNSGSPPKS